MFGRRKRMNETKWIDIRNKILFRCDHTKCNCCADNPNCLHTLDIAHSQRYNIMQNGDYIIFYKENDNLVEAHPDVRVYDEDIREKIAEAYNELVSTLDAKRITKAELNEAISTAVGYLGELLE